MFIDKKNKLEQWIKGLLYISPFIFPLYLLRFKIGPFPFTGLEIFTYAVFGLYFLGLIRGRLKFEAKASLKWAYFLLLLLFLGALLGAAMAPSQMVIPGDESISPQMISLGILKGWIFAPMLYFLTFTQVVRDPGTLKKILLNFIFSGTVVALVSYFFGLFGSGFASDFRFIGFFESANYLALYLVPSLLLSFSYFFQPQSLSPKEKFLNLMAGMVMLHALLLTQSYAGILAVFGSLGLYVLILLIKNQRNSRKLFWALILVVLAFIGLLASQINSPKFQQFLDWQHRSSTSVRLEIYQVSLAMIKEHPFTGLGPGLFQPYYQTEAPLVLKRAPLEWNMPHPHNLFLAFWLNAGLLGFLAFLGFLILVHRKFTYLWIPFWGILIHGLFDMPFWKNDLAMIFWLILASILVLPSIDLIPKNKSSKI